jgi:hypothetical protein
MHGRSWRSQPLEPCAKLKSSVHSNLGHRPYASLHSVGHRAAGSGGEGVCISGGPLVEAGREALPLVLTEGQERALGAILGDLQGPAPMMCLLQARPSPWPPLVPLVSPPHLAWRCLLLNFPCAVYARPHQDTG